MHTSRYLKLNYKFLGNFVFLLCCPVMSPHKRFPSESPRSFWEENTAILSLEHWPNGVVTIEGPDM